jgi:hypothetical protein
MQRERALDVHQQLFRVVRLGEIAEDAVVHRLYRVGNRAVGREDDDWQAGMRDLDLPEERHAVHALHAQVGEHQVRAGRGDGGERPLAAVDRGDLVAVGLEADREEPEEIRVVVDEQQRSVSVPGH